MRLAWPVISKRPFRQLLLYAVNKFFHALQIKTFKADLALVSVGQVLPQHKHGAAHTLAWCFLVKLTLDLNHAIGLIVRLNQDFAVFVLDLKKGQLGLVGQLQCLQAQAQRAVNPRADSCQDYIAGYCFHDKKFCSGRFFW